jgi:hypothetical protein
MWDTVGSARQRRGRARHHVVLLRAFAMAVVLAAALAAPSARAQSPAAPLPGFAELEAAGARIGTVRIRALDIFDTSDPAESNVIFRAANALHIRTRPWLIEGSLLFRTGDPVSVKRIEETERVLRATRSLFDVQIRPTAVNEGVVDVEVVTRDTWTFDPGFSASRAGGSNTTSYALREYNLLGTGLGISFGRYSNVDRSGNDFAIGGDRLFGSTVSASFQQTTNSDGSRLATRLARPFHELDARWAAGITASFDDRIDPLYRSGEVVSRYRRTEDRVEAFGGLSEGLVDGWVRRWSAGVSMLRDTWRPEPGFVPPPVLPADETLVAPFLRMEMIEDRIVTSRNLNQMGRPEFLPMGLQTVLQIGYASQAFGSTRDALRYAASVSRGFEPGPNQTMLASAKLEGRYADGAIERQRLGGQLQYFLPQGRRWLFYAGLSGDMLTHPGPLDMLTLGGDNGLRGYPLRYQTGTQRALLTLEERFYSDLYVFRLFRVGGAGFIDVGRAWGGPNAGPESERWLADAGFGLRIFSVRAAFSNVLHVDLAFPLYGDSNVKTVQFLVRTRASF